MDDKRTRSAMELSGRYLKAAFTGLVVGYCLALVLGRSIWLEMRVNTGHAIPITAACSVLFFGPKKRPVPLASCLLLELLAVVLPCAMYGFGASTMLIVPAAVFREAFHLGSLSLAKMDGFLLCLVGAANGVWIYAAAAERRRSGRRRCRPADAYARGSREN